ncbi:MAG: VCBS repeat-containing protein [bacterium]|nr:VCBS repeat-containing protein [bacterium]
MKLILRPAAAAWLPLAALLFVAGCGGKSQPASPVIDGPVAFRRQVVDAAPPGGEDCCTDVCAAGDLDGDGYADLVLGGEHADGPGLFWYQYPQWDKRPLASGQFTTDMQLADIDGDTHLDIVVGDTDRGLLWLRNPGDLKADWPAQDRRRRRCRRGHLRQARRPHPPADGTRHLAIAHAGRTRGRGHPPGRP